ncbi:MAG: N-acetylmuramic acid 6-phosphate etherase [Ruminococcaceae bacterium]|nr:N-acetylmuramic acid 6-phosphate etherase [Oscillospiraceae bacterium]
MLNTEKRNEKTTHIDKMQTSQMVKIMQEENLNAVNAINTELDAISLCIDKIDERMKKGGRLFYIGCGTSGRLGVLDASECPPTYGVPYDLVVGIMAGGDKAIRKAVEGAEDSFESGYEDIKNYNITENDSVVGISVAGGAKYVLGAFKCAKESGALIVALTCNAGSKIEQEADVVIHPDTGAEVVTGSTRMKAGTSHKMILNMISTAVMIKQGHVYENLMINLKPSNEKLYKRMISIVSDITGKDYEESEKLLKENNFVIRDAIDNSK